MNHISEWKEKIVWPDIESWDWEQSARNNYDFLEQYKDKYICTTIFSGFFERLITFLDFENACISLILEDDQEEVHALFGQLCDLYEAIILKIKTHYHPDMIEVHDDWGSQRSPLFSLETCREMIVPYLKRIVDFCHAHDMDFQLHSCGCIEPLIPAVIESGVDLWIPQSSANDLYGIHQTFKDHFVVAARRVLLPDMNSAEYKQAIDTFFENTSDAPILFFDDFPTEEIAEYFQNHK